MTEERKQEVLTKFLRHLSEKVSHTIVHPKIPRSIYCFSNQIMSVHLLRPKTLFEVNM